MTNKTLFWKGWRLPAVAVMEQTGGPPVADLPKNSVSKSSISTAFAAGVGSRGRMMAAAPAIDKR